jgi:hypothetical protein
VGLREAGESSAGSLRLRRRVEPLSRRCASRRAWNRWRAFRRHVTGDSDSRATAKDAVFLIATQRV